MIRWGLFIGTTSGIVLGLYMWFVEKITGDKVYTLLMNVDFIPWFGSIDWPVLMEWFFHMIISWIIGLVYAWLFMYRVQSTSRNHWRAAALLTAPAALAYVPLTILALKETPPVTDGSAVLFWLFGHVLYAVTLKKSYDRFT